MERANPTALYPAILAESFRRIGASLGAVVSDEWAEKLGASVPSWPAFPDSADALSSLAEDYKLIIVSNVHHQEFAGSNPRLGVTFDKIITAEHVGRTSRHRTTSKLSMPHWRSSTCYGYRNSRLNTARTRKPTT